MSKLPAKERIRILERRVKALDNGMCGHVSQYFHLLAYHDALNALDEAQADLRKEQVQ